VDFTVRDLAAEKREAQKQARLREAIERVREAGDREKPGAGGWGLTPRRSCRDSSAPSALAIRR
jgi:hypothetical protein